MGSPSELRIICKKQFAWAHGFGHVFKIELILLATSGLAVSTAAQQEHAHRARKQR